LYLTTIRQIRITLGSLPALLLAGFTKVFRKSLQVPEEVPAIADQSL
jgi:hypothetical protein